MVTPRIIITVQDTVELSLLLELLLVATATEINRGCEKPVFYLRISLMDFCLKFASSISNKIICNSDAVM